MMNLLRVLLTLALCLTTVTAFFPFATNPYCKDIGGCLGPTDDSDATPELNNRAYSDLIAVRSNVLSHVLEHLGYKDKRDNNYPKVLSNDPTDPNSIPIHQDGHDFSYFTTVQIGTPPVQFYMLVDTGATDSWLMSKDCTSDACQTRNTFDYSASSSFKNTTDAFGVAYGTGEISGNYMNDQISVAGFNLSLKMGLVSTASSQFLNYPFDGILGLGLTSNGPSAFLTTLFNSKSLQTNTFGINLDRAADNTKGGELTFGGTASSKFTGDISYVPLATSVGQWSVNCDGIAVAGKNFTVNKPVMLDTGSSFLYFSSEDAASIHSQITGSSLHPDGVYYNIPCDGQSPLELTFDGATYAIPTQDWVGVSTSDGVCVSNIYPGTPIANGVPLLGDSFLKNVYTVFDWDQKRVGFAQKAVPGNGSSLSTTSAGEATTSSDLSSSTSTISSSTPGSEVSSQATTTTNAASSGISNSTTTTSAPIPSMTVPIGGFNGGVSSDTASTATAVVSSSTSAPAPSATGNSGVRFGNSILLSVAGVILAVLF